MDKIVPITGASSRIGKGIAWECRGEGVAKCTPPGPHRIHRRRHAQRGRGRIDVLVNNESRSNRFTCVNPGVVASELASTITHEETMAAMDAYRATAPQSTDIARAVRQVIEASAGVDTAEISIRPTVSGN